MFQYFYLISLLLCIKLVFSYEYLDDAPGRTFHSFSKNARKVSTSGKRKDRISSIRQEYGYDKNPVEFDVAGFIQPDEEAIADYEDVRRRNQRRRRISKNNEDDSGFGLNMIEGNSREASQDYLSFADSQAKLNPTLMDLSPPLLKDSLNIKKFKMSAMDGSNAKYGHDNFKNQMVLPEQNSPHNPQKKCILKNLKLPFFSRYNKTEALKPKKTRKRKLFCLNCSKKKTKEKDMQLESIPEDKKSKRSYEENMCPACKKKFITFESNDKRKNKKLHNRLIVEKYTDVKMKENSKAGPNKFNSDEFGEDIYDIQRNKREKANKREDPGILMRRELDVIQQTIEHDDVRSPAGAKAPGSTATTPE